MKHGKVARREPGRARESESTTDDVWCERTSGLLLHPTSLPGPHGNGDLGPSAHRFVQFLARAGQTWWQMLPVGPPGRDYSPYDSRSSFAGSPLLVSLELLARDGWLEPAELAAPHSLGSGQVNYERAHAYRRACLRRAAERFGQRGGYRSRKFCDFVEAARDWLDDHALYCALQDAHHGAPWTSWEPELRQREPRALERARQKLDPELRYHRFVQYAFALQWSRLRQACHEHGVRLLGDLPMFVAHDSADVWANPELFCLDASGNPTVVAGVPPDYFSPQGQLWGNPVYRWDRLALDDFAWWKRRIAASLARFDALRLDHFIGLYRYWQVPARARTARRGRFVLVPGAKLLATLERELGHLPLLAEDLGLLVPEVAELRDRFGLPGMRVLQFGFGDAPGDRDHLPHRYPRRVVAYTGTHDNDTLLGWFRQRAPEGDRSAREALRRRRQRVLRYAGTGIGDLGWRLIEIMLLSPANTVIFPLQDLLGLGSRARMNLPGTTGGNWRWRMPSDQLDFGLADRMRERVETYDRLPSRQV